MYKASLTGVSFSFGEHSPAYYLPVAHKRGVNAPRRALRDVLRACEGVTLIAAHNVSHELLSLSTENYDSSDWNWAGTDVMMWMTQNFAPGKSKLGLKALMEHFFKQDRPNFNEVTGGRNFDELLPEEGAEYACYDAYDALRLWERFSDDMSKYEGMEEAFWKREMPFTRVIRHMEDTGMAVDVPTIRRLEERYSTELVPLLEEWNFLTDGMNPRSSKQLQRFYNDGTWSTKGIQRKKTGFSTDSDSIEFQLRVRKPGSLGHVLAELRLRIQLLSKLLSTYTGKMVYLSEQYPDKRLHCSFNHTGTATGRISSNYPNLLNFPVRTEEGQALLEAFHSPSGAFVSADFSQIELRVLAHLTGEPALVKAYTTGGDVHQTTADMLGMDRFTGKTVNFAVMYGATENRLMRLLGVTKSKAKSILDGYWGGYSKIQQFRSEQVAFAYKHGYVRTEGGCIRNVERWLGSSNRYQRLMGERIVMNTPVQGFAASLIKESQIVLLDLLKSEGFQDRMPNQIYDNLLFYTTKSRANTLATTVKEVMENTHTLRVPLLTEPKVGETWMDVK